MAVKGGWEKIAGGSGEELLKREETINLDGNSQSLQISLISG